MNVSVKNRIKEAYESFKARGLGESREAIEQFFELNIVHARLGNTQGQELFHLQPFTLRYEKERFIFN